MSCLCNKRIKENNAKLATMNYKSCTIAAATVEAREQRRFRMPKYTMASSNVGTETTQIGWNPGPSSCIYELEQTAGRLQHKWELVKVGDEWKVVESKKTLNAEGGVAKIVAACDEAGGESAKRNDNEAGPSGINWTSVAESLQARGGIAGRDDDEAGLSRINDDEAGPSGINASEAASVEVTGTGLVNGRPVINRLYIEQLFASSDDSDDDWWDPDEGFHEVCIEGKNIKILSMNV
jgi:hypothetical protein